MVPETYRHTLNRMQTLQLDTLSRQGQSVPETHRHTLNRGCRHYSWTLLAGTVSQCSRHREIHYDWTHLAGRQSLVRALFTAR